MLYAVLFKIMKARDYFEKYVNENSDKSNDWKLIKAFRDIVCEAEEIAKLRNAETDKAYHSIFNELNIKANSFIRMVNDIDDMGIKKDAFKIFIQLESPELFKAVFPNGI